MQRKKAAGDRKLNNLRGGRLSKGSITLEAAITLPLFIIAVIMFAFVIKLYYTQEIIQQAITGASSEMSVYSLLYYKTDAEELMGGIEKFGNSEKVGEVLEDVKLTPYIQQFGKDAADYLRAQAALVPITKVLVKKKLEVSYFGSVDERLKSLSFKDGFDSIDFTSSRILEDNKSIDIVAKYKMSFPFLGDILPEIKVVQTASACIWAGEDGIKTGEDSEETLGEGIWDMDNMKRGKEIRKLQGANLPFNFPVVAKFEGGTVTSIKSLNLDEVYYSNPRNLEQKILVYIKKLEEFSGGTAGGVSIGNNQIFRKELLLIIPETEALPEQQSIFEKCVQTAANKGVSLKIIKAYGKKGSGGSGGGELESDGED